MCDGDTHTHSHTYEYPSFLVTASTSNHRCGYAVRYSTSAHVRTYTRISGSSEQKKEKARLFLLLLPQTAFRISLSLFGVTHTHTHTHVYHILPHTSHKHVFSHFVFLSRRMCVSCDAQNQATRRGKAVSQNPAGGNGGHTRNLGITLCVCVWREKRGKGRARW